MHELPYLQIFLLLSAVWIIGRIFQRFKWPALFGELLAGLFLGPLVLGVVDSNDGLMILSELGVFFLMLHAGLETSPSDLFKASKRSFLVALGGGVLPFAVAYYAGYMAGYTQMEAVFMGMGSSITSLAVSAKLFKDAGITKSCVANVTMGAAILQDIFGLILFSTILNVAENGVVDFEAIGILVLKMVLFFSVVMFVGQKFFKQINVILYKGNKGFTFTIVLALAFGLFAELIGLHIIIGALLAGLFIREEVIEHDLFEKIEDRVFGLSYSFLGPIFFATLAFNLDFAALATAPWFLLIFIVVAVLSKVIGAGLAAYYSGLDKVDSFGVGLATNSRGAVELIVAAIGLERGIIGPEVFSILVIMAFATTLISILGLKPLSEIISKKQCS